MIDFIVNIYQSIIPYEYRPFELWYKLKCWLFRPFTTIKPRYLPHTWTDRSVQLPHAMFEILSHFIEKENPGETINWAADPEHAHAWAEMNELYNWWHNVYIPWDNSDNRWDDPDIVDRQVEQVDGHYRQVFSSEEVKEKHRAALKRIFDEEERMRVELIARCKRLCDIQDFLWT